MSPFSLKKKVFTRLYINNKLFSPLMYLYTLFLYKKPDLGPSPQKLLILDPRREGPMVSGPSVSQLVTRDLENGSENLFDFWHEGRGPLVEKVTQPDFYPKLSFSQIWGFSPKKYTLSQLQHIGEWCKRVFCLFGRPYVLYLSSC